MSLYWYACISTNTYCFEMPHWTLGTYWWALSNTSSTVQIRLAVHEIFADKAFIATDGLISQSFVVAFVHPTYVRMALIWGFLAQLSLWKSVHLLWRYKLNEVYDTKSRNQSVFYAIFADLSNKCKSFLIQVITLSIFRFLEWSLEFYGDYKEVM